MRYMKKPIAIEAWQSFKNAGAVTSVWPAWIIEALTNSVIFEREGEIYIKTLEGEMHVSDGDWIIQGVQGELYPCKPDIFEQTYDEVHDD